MNIRKRSKRLSQNEQNSRQRTQKQVATNLTQEKMRSSRRAPPPPRLLPAVGRMRLQDAHIGMCDQKQSLFLVFREVNYSLYSS